MIQAHTFDPYRPPEFTSDSSRECAICQVEIDLDDTDHTYMDNGSVLCSGCRVMCVGTCGEFLTDLKACAYLRCAATGKREAWCAACAAEDWLERLISFADDNDFFANFPTSFSCLPQRKPWAIELGADQIARLYSFYVTEGGVA